MSLASFGSSLLGYGRRSPDGVPSLVGRFDGDHILVPVFCPTVPAVTDQVEVATSLARVTGASLSVIDPVQVPERPPMEFGPELAAADDDALLDWALEQTTDATERVDGDFLCTRDAVKGVLRAVDTHEVDTLVLPSGSSGGRLRRGVTERIAARTDCDVVVVGGQAGLEKVASVLLPIAGGPHSGLAVDLAQYIAVDRGAWIDILHVVDEDASDRERERAEALVEDAYHRIAQPETTTTWVLEAADPAEAILEQSRYYGLTVVGAPTRGRLRQFIHGSTTRSVRANARSVVLSVKYDAR